MGSLKPMPIRSRTAVFGAAGCLVLLALVWLAAFHIGFFRHADQSIYLQFGGLHVHSGVERVAGWFVGWFDPNPYVYLVLVPLIVALSRGRPRVVLAVAAIVLGANVTTELLKHIAAAPRPASLFSSGVSPLPPASWPSGHATAAMSLVLASVLATGMHYPSDVLGGFLVAAIWALAMVVALLALERRRPSRRTRSGPVSIRAALGAPGAVLGAALVLGAIVAISRPYDVMAYARAHEAFVVGAAGIAALSLALSTGVLLSVRR